MLISNMLQGSHGYGKPIRFLEVCFPGNESDANEQNQESQVNFYSKISLIGILIV